MGKRFWDPEVQGFWVEVGVEQGCRLQDLELLALNPEPETLKRLSQATVSSRAFIANPSFCHSRLPRPGDSPSSTLIRYGKPTNPILIGRSV